MIGETLAQYKVLSKLGAGGMGEVYLAEDTNLKRRVALKVIPDEMADDPGRLRRFKTEAEAVAALNHPNIVTIHTIEEVAGRRILVMELVEGQSLDGILSPEGLPLSKVLDIAVPLTDALATAHEKGIVHRDLKPANIMVRPDGQVKVLDFGLAKFTSGSDSASAGDPSTDITRTVNLTAEGTVIGTAPYMSPEQLKGLTVDHRTDIFSLGILLYEMVTGALPFKSGNGLELASKILQETPPSVSEVRSDLPRSLDHIINTCLKKDPDQRYQSAADIRRELLWVGKEAESGTDSTADSASAQGRSRDRLRSPIGGGKRRWVGMVAVVGALLAFGIWWLGRDGGPGVDPQHDFGPEASQKIAVLPFAARGTGPNTSSFADGVHDDLLTTLTGISGLKVISRTSVMQYRDTTKNLRQIGWELGAANLLEGAVQQVGDQVRINVQLIDAATDEHLWAQTYDRELSVENLFSIQSEIVQTISEALSVTLTADEADRINREPTNNLEAFYAYNRGKQLFNRSTFESLRAAQQEFEGALEIDPDYVLANIMLARTFAMLAMTGAAPREEMLRQGRPFIDRAIDLDPDNPHALAVLGDYLSMEEEPGAQEVFDRALESGPNLAEVLDIYAGFLRRQQRNTEAIGIIDRALELDPLSASLFHDLGRARIAVGQFEEATAAFRRIAQIDPDNPYAAHGSALATILGGKLPEAAYWSDLASTYDPADFENFATSAFVYLSFGDFETAAARVDTALAIGPGEPFPLAAKAVLLTVRGDREGAVTIARTALASQLDDRWRSDFVFLRVMRDEAVATGQFKEALAWYRLKTPELFNEPPDVNAGNVQKAVDLAHLLQLTGDSESAETILAAAIEAYDQRYTLGAANFPLGVAKAEALALLGRSTEAIASLRKVVADGWRLDWQWDTLFNRNFDTIRSDPGFIAVVEEIEADLAAQDAAFNAEPLRK